MPQTTDEHKLEVTQTGILSNRRPAAVSRALSADETTSRSGPRQSSLGSSGVTSYDLLALARREAAKKELYSRFHRGAVLHHDESLVTCQEEHQETVPESVQKQEKSERRKRKRKLALMRDSTEQDIDISKRRRTSS